MNHLKDRIVGYYQAKTGILYPVVFEDSETTWICCGRKDDIYFLNGQQPNEKYLCPQCDPKRWNFIWWNSEDPEEATLEFSIDYLKSPENF